jgi:membrane dipeptidase
MYKTNMNWRYLTLLLLGGFLIGSGSVIDPVKLHRDALVADLHSDTVLRMKKGFDFSLRDTTGHMDIPRLLEGGVDLQVFACWIPTSTPRDSCRIRVDEMIDSLEAQVNRHQDKIAICTTAEQARKIIESGRIAAFIGIENGVAIENNLRNLQHCYDRGVRYMTLTHTSSSDWCISSADTAPKFDGLTDFGRDVVRKMNELGMIIDISHASAKAVEEVIKITQRPIIASHSCVYNICHHDRNLIDSQIRAIAKNGGVIGINFYSGYLSSRWMAILDSSYAAHKEEIDSVEALYKNDYAKRHDVLAAFYTEMGRKLGETEVNIDTVVNHIDYVVKLVGPDHVGLGSDFDGVFGLPDGLKDCSMMPNITKELVARGYSESDIRKILGGNFMRVFEQVCGK